MHKWTKIGMMVAFLASGACLTASIWSVYNTEYFYAVIQLLVALAYVSIGWNQFRELANQETQAVMNALEQSKAANEMQRQVVLKAFETGKPVFGELENGKARIRILDERD